MSHLFIFNVRISNLCAYEVGDVGDESQDSQAVDKAKISKSSKKETERDQQMQTHAVGVRCYGTGPQKERTWGASEGRGHL